MEPTSSDVKDGTAIDIDAIYELLDQEGNKPKAFTSTQQASLGVGTLILVAMIVLFFRYLTNGFSRRAVTTVHRGTSDEPD